jgi:Tfp pilus assembly protein PilO
MYSQSPAGAAPYIEIPITINLRCSYHDLGRFINMIENSDRFMKVTDLTINTNPDPMVHNIRLIVNIFVLKKR